MKVKIMSLLMVAGIILGGCQGNTNDEGMTDRNNQNVDPIRNSDDNRADRIDNRDRNNRTNEMNRDNRTNEPNTRNISDRNQGTNDQYDIAEEAAEKITNDIDEIDNAYVLTTNNNAYVAAVLDNDNNDNRQGTADTNQKNNKDAKARNISNKDNDQDHTGGELTDDVKKEISDIVQSVDNNIDNVYISTNPDFADLTTDYVDQMNNGKPIRGFFDEIGNMIERVFPQDKK